MVGVEVGVVVCVVWGVVVGLSILLVLGDVFEAQPNNVVFTE